MGLACALELLKSGHSVILYEADDRVGGMTAHFDFNGLSIERYYHFICMPDQPMFDVLAELNISDKLHWRTTKMGYYYNGKLYDWGNPIALLKFKPLSFIDRLRYGLHMFYCTKIKDGSNLDSQEASNWIKNWIGQRAYNVLWKKLFELKFHKFTNNLSASWIWARIRRVGTSRKNLFTEQMGYLEGGSETLLKAFEKAIIEKKGAFHLSTKVKKIIISDGKVKGLMTGDNDVDKFDHVISTIPLPFVPDMIDDLPEHISNAYKKIDNIGVVCVIIQLKKQVTENFWLNINDERLDVPGIIEYSNLRDLDVNVVYVPFYLPRDNKKFQRVDQDFIDEARAIIKTVNPSIQDDDIIDIHASRYGYAQPICPPEFKATLPPLNGIIEGLIIADTSYYYPEDRSISESVDLGKSLATLVQ
ncbi:Phytoene desaturase [hydrothermal vent metagenome]|uniref:Phytoene desaturase n=1 Tax=hydrothermal vent metagenome TaxID=652676 RepID=A0A3B0ZGT6_9ZZZZ